MVILGNSHAPSPEVDSKQTRREIDPSRGAASSCQYRFSPFSNGSCRRRGAKLLRPRDVPDLSRLSRSCRRPCWLSSPPSHELQHQRLPPLVLRSPLAPPRRRASPANTSISPEPAAAPPRAPGSPCQWQSGNHARPECWSSVQWEHGKGAKKGDRTL
jgi:hypothetical protein